MLNYKQILTVTAFLLTPMAVHASPCEVQDDVEDKWEAVGGFFERNWEKLEDAVIPETEEERREEAAERAEDAAEEAAEERKCQDAA